MTKKGGNLTCMIGTRTAINDKAKSRKPRMSICRRFDKQCWAQGKCGSVNQHATVALVLAMALVPKTHR